LVLGVLGAMSARRWRVCFWEGEATAMHTIEIR
jgi:hypothetical protein